jgi:ABC-type multidrug transport system ATPase subunit
VAARCTGAGQELEEAIDAALKSVNLFNAKVGDKYAGKYSGGMKRRLSVAISFIGAPKVVYLDEPSTGLDPSSRRNLWDVVRANKGGRSIILTTHSMEEAETLCDRLGIFVDGQLVCIGNPKEITSRYAGFFVFSISVPMEQEGRAKAVVLAMAPGAVLTYSLSGTLKYELPTSQVSLSGVFKAVNDAKTAGLTILDWGVANATLEEVFIKLAKNIGAQSKDD